MSSKIISEDLPNSLNKRNRIKDDKIVSNNISDNESGNGKCKNSDETDSLSIMSDTITIKKLSNGTSMMDREANEFINETGYLKRNSNDNAYSNSNILDASRLKSMNSGNHKDSNLLFPIPDHSHSSGNWSPNLRSKRNSISIMKEKVIETSKDIGQTFKDVAGRSVRNEVIKFGGSTSAHGLPLLQFDSAKFPAITICNLNAFKKHLAKTVPELQETLQAFKQAVRYSKGASNHLQNDIKLRNKRNSFRYVQYEPVISDCECPVHVIKTKEGELNECLQKDGVPSSNSSTCICNFDRQDDSVWPCYKESTWRKDFCPECNDIGYCNLPDTNGTKKLPCLCQNNVGYCLLQPDRIKKVWEIKGTAVPSEDSPYRDDFLKQLKELGYENTTDEVAITTKTKEKLVLTMAGLPVQRRIALGYGKSEFIKMCSFNGNQCDIVKDFKLHVDPAFGNCYTFNYNQNKSKIFYSSRAGPSYGLRMMLYVNSSDYLPTTEATGVRIAIHDQSVWPFPDTFGYSAPTGAISSFGLSLRKFRRLGPPYGDCVEANGTLPNDYIFKNNAYEPEGCYRSCYQTRIIQKCNCGDPRYPVSNNRTKYCDILDVTERQCLLHEGIKFTKDNDCKCRHPCQQNVWTTTYSAAKWPSGSFKVGSCNKSLEDCINHYSTHAAMVEIYYEQMSYEKLQESESYLFVNLISDIGGQAGLWLGASVITICEITFFLLRLLTVYCRKPMVSAKNESEIIGRKSKWSPVDINLYGNSNNLHT
uniref:SET domain-containing protein n=1 Tax=Strongyloides papillosus TaxID=174720 RepID=A0A0N5B8A6_STREA